MSQLTSVTDTSGYKVHPIATKCNLSKRIRTRCHFKSSSGYFSSLEFIKEKITTVITYIVSCLYAKMYAESLITSKLNTHYGSPSTSQKNHGPYQQNYPYKSQPLHPGANHSNSHTNKNTQ